MLPFTTTLPRTELATYTARQIGAFFPDRDETSAIRTVMEEVLVRLEHCIRHVRIKGFWLDTGPRFDHLRTDQYAVYLYYLANTAFLAGERSLADKAYALNKALHGLDAYYEIGLPAIFAVVHPVGTVLGRATYGDYFCAYQGVSVGADLDGTYPTIGKGVVMYGGSRVVGDVRIGDNCLISAGASLLKGKVPDGHVAFGQHPAVTCKPTRHNVIHDIFKDRA